jgi:hypothetical protein
MVPPRTFLVLFVLVLLWIAPEASRRRSAWSDVEAATPPPPDDAVAAAAPRREGVNLQAAGCSGIRANCGVTAAPVAKDEKEESIGSPAAECGLFLDDDDDDAARTDLCAVK